MNCQNCIYVGSVPGSHHRCCNVIENQKVKLLLAGGMIQLTDKYTKVPLVIINEHGKKNGWAMWPINFDPIWIDNCHFFTEKTQLTNS